MNENLIFCRLLLSEARAQAKRQGVKLPKRITAMRSDKTWFFVEANEVKGVYIKADNAFHAKAEYIFGILNCEYEGQIQP